MDPIIPIVRCDPFDDPRVRGDAICALISGMSYEACFDLDRTGAKSLRGSLPAIGRFAACQFTKRPNQAGMANTSLPLSIQPTDAPSSRYATPR